ncbi:MULTISPECIES: DUF4190 domain-containing protein [Pseudomonas syringae group]|uniref:DUF4190 domain-containing protein n=1 Tax=Pseudomonas syringae group TaxID=136849 RepID=UPI0006D62E3A|nr:MULTISPECIES: DUF4190 domain-containing protein [Pseudomonas syringae group]KPX28755.1 Uncharacterized protein ALO77_03997 [Pseudomonas coronafaciens pv. garcae]MCF5804344.1 DUF4190 domain-containing protein [Pseudomonas tremae]MCF5811482.1 DUF4190 domain-containing protein [Pseudomonas tremae]RMS93157.1 hypothetical protein ALP56_01600 [Pseudomonas coronafaciens pv. oryzae]RMT00942.1 hypothetical protein ALP57_03928 [Pseudomonas coronafaciens pv. oryzae]
MAMVFCRGCAKEIHETALSCPQCGASQISAIPAKQLRDAGSPWMAITSLVLSIVCTLALFDDGEWDLDTIVGLGMFSITGLVLGVISINKKKPGNGLAIAGTVLSAVSLLIFIGLITN